MATSDTVISDSNFFITKKELFGPTELSNTDEPSDYVEESYSTSELNQLEIFTKLVESGLTNESEIKTFYLNIYQQLIKNFIKSANNSVFLREAVNDTSYSGLDIFKTINFLDFLDIQQLKDELNNSLSNDPCILLDSKPKPTIHPLKEQMLKMNFRALCRLHISYLKVCNLYLSSVFNNSEFYSKDTTFTTFAFFTFKGQMQRLIPNYYNSIKVFLYDELNTLLESGTEFVDEITKDKYEFSFPLNDENLDSNIDKYLNYLFNKEHVFVANKYNTAFSQLITNSDGITPFSFYPTSNISQSLYSVQDYFFDSLRVVTKTPNTIDSVFQATILALNEIDNTYVFLLLDINDVEVDEETKLRTYKLSLNLSRLFDSKPIEIDGATVSITKSISIDQDYPTTGAVEISDVLLELKSSFLSNSRIQTIINYVFPLNKILNIASFFYIQANMKTYEIVTNAVDGSIKTIDTVHNMILGNEDKIDCEQPEDPLSLDNPILGINLEIAKMIAQAPVQILKGLEETYDPNIAIASKLRDLSVAAGLPPTPVALWSLALLPVGTIPPPVGIGPPLIPPWGYIYWGVDAGEVLTSYAKNGFDTNSKATLELKAKISISDNPFKNKNC